MNKRYWVTQLLVVINSMVFIMMTLQYVIYYHQLGGTQNIALLLDWGALYPPLVLQQGEWYRLCTALFIHIGVVHLLFNMLTLYFMGRLIEPLIGHWRFLAFYMISGVLGNALTLYFGRGNVVSAGASTALFGLCGFFVAIGILYHDQTSQQLFKQFGLLIILNLIYDLSDPSIGIVSHITGAIVGILVAVMWLKWRQYKAKHIK